MSGRVSTPTEDTNQMLKPLPHDEVQLLMEDRASAACQGTPMPAEPDPGRFIVLNSTTLPPEKRRGQKRRCQGVTTIKCAGNGISD